MVPKVAAKGTSFKGAGAYYLHDKKADSSERVEFTQTENLPVNDPQRAIDCMAYTAMHQNEIKAANGAARTGRKLTCPVYTYSLSWAPDEKPTQEQMIAAGRETLKALGLDDHEVLMVAHNDEPHPHLHLIVNRVNPNTGKAAVLSNDHLMLSRWAEAYEKMQGEIRCEQRVENNEKRRNGTFVKNKGVFDRGAFHRWRSDRLKRAFAVRKATAENLSAHHAGQREALYDDKERRIREFRQDQKDANRYRWAALYRQQKHERQELAAFQASPVSRLAYWLRNRDLERDGAIAGALKALTGLHRHKLGLAKKHDQQREALSLEIGNDTRRGIQEINKRYRAELNALKAEQTQERQALQKAHSAESQERARDIREERDKTAFLKETGLNEKGESLSDEFTKRVADRIRRRKEEQERDRQKGRDDKGGGRER